MTANLATEYKYWHIQTGGENKIREHTRTHNTTYLSNEKY